MDWTEWTKPIGFLAAFGFVTLCINLIALCIVVSQFRRNVSEAALANRIKRAEFIHRINDSLAHFATLRIRLERNELKPDDPDHFVQLRDYAIIFENVYCLIDSEVLTEAEVYRYFGARFAEFDRHPKVAEAMRREEFRDMTAAFERLRRIVAQHWP
jgi:hypothetical protein